MNFDIIRPLFGGKLTQHQVNGINDVIDEWHKDETNTDVRQLAYVLATIFHETNKSMQPVEEAGYLSKKAQMAYLEKQKYYPYFGRDLVHTTWLTNYQKVKNFSGIDVVTNPELIAEMPLAAQVAITFMKNGWYTGKKLSDYFNEIKEDAINARRIINGLDKAELITGYYTLFKKALNKS